MDKQYKVTAIILSYNRPNMLREALASAKDADEVFLLDDGSDFDVVSLAKEFSFDKFQLIMGPQITTEERLKKQRVAVMINEALRQATGDIITYLCDDDIFAPKWISALKTFFAKHGEKYHFVRGNCVRFEKDYVKSLEKDSTMHLIVFADSPRQLITGNFAHLRKCTSEEGRMWPEDKVVGHDTAFFDNMDEVHDTWTIPLIPEIACFRRIHDKMLTNFTYYNADGTVTVDEFSPEAKDMLRNNKFLE
jgi:glycosyltransferase involved in cell wall biosynthesis